MPYFSLSFAKKKYIVNATKFWSLLVVILALLVADIVWLFIKYKTLNFHIFLTVPPLVAIISGLIILGIVILFSRIMFQVDKRLDAKMEEYLKNYEHAHKGDDGEQLVYQNLTQWLNPEHYKIYPNYTIPGVVSDFDFIVVGLAGIILIEVKNYSTQTIFTYDKAYYRSKEGKLIKLRDIREVVGWRAKKLEMFLAKQGVSNTKVRKVVLFVNPNSVEVQGDWQNKYKVYVAQGIFALEKYISEKYVDNKFTKEYIALICNLLDKKTKFVPV